MKRHTRHYIARNFLIAVSDFFSLASALVIGYWLWAWFPWHGNYQPFEDYSRILWFLPPIGILVFNRVGLYKSEVGILGVEEQSLIFKAIWIIYLIGLAISFFYRDTKFSRLATLYSVFIAIALISLERFLFRQWLARQNQKGIGVCHALIYGAGYHGQRLERWILQSPKLGIRVAGYLDDEIHTLTRKPAELSCLGGIAELKKIVQQKNIEVLFIAHRKLSEERVVGIFQTCRDLGIQCWSIPALSQFYIERARLFNIGGIPLVGFREGFGRRSYSIVKRFLDILVGSAALVIAAPLMLLIMGMMRLSTTGPIFFRQTRVGKDSKKFTMSKFRTLKRGGHAEISPELKRGSHQMLPFGGFLRRTGLDELPQLFHVLKGEMSLVGPRPEMPFIVEKYGPLERERLSVKPGITGLWQVSEDRKRLLIHENMDYDLYYIERFSFNLDLAILFKTATTIFKRTFSL